MPAEKRENFFTELLKFVLLALVIVVPVRLFVAQPFFVSGESMSPTFEDGQYLIVDEITYHFDNPQRGDVIVFQAPGQPPGTYYIKRIIGLPGEVVHISASGVSITKTDGETVEVNDSYVANHGNGDDETYSVPQDEYFVMGDNRPESSDSRSWGFLPRENIVGRALLRLLPPQAIALFPGFAVEPQ